MQTFDQEFYRAHGYIVLKNIAEPALMNRLCQSTFKVFQKLAGKYSNSLKPPSNWNDFMTRFSEPMMHFRSTDPSEFGVFYDTLQTTTSLHALFTTQSIILAAASALKDLPDGLASSGYMLRMDAPKDSRNSLQWHQDSSYYKQNLDGNNGVVAIVPLVSVSEKNGSLQILSGSHKEGTLKINSSGKKSEITSEQFQVPEQIVKKYRITTLFAEPGDLVLCHMDLIHKSGKNNSDFFRLTSAVRLHRILAEDFLPGRLEYRPNKMIEERRKAILS
jgi:ectoine hydroxylase-related dioxygenase (phytanoyl-CoA dioxygenase family)